MKKILFITNGHGEDIVAAHIIQALKLREIKMDVLPVVGNGDAFKELKVNVIGPVRALPSGGFGMRNYSFLFRDIFAGLIGKVLSQIRLLRKKKYRYDLVIGIGDIVPVIYAVINGSRFIFIGINKSEYYTRVAFNYTSLEKLLLKKYCSLTLARDQKTADVLQSQGIKAKFIGNPMMDGVRKIRKSGYQKIGQNKKQKVIGFLPGTREDAYKNIDDFQMIAWRIKRLDYRIKFLMSFPSSLDRQKLARIIPMVDIPVSEDFNEVLSSSDAVIGLSGTGNEQAAGAGLPVIAFPGRGAQYNFKFAAAQKELLGDALMLMPRNSQVIAHEAVSLLYSKKRLAAMSKAGKERMGRSGASKKMASIIAKLLKSD